MDDGQCAAADGIVEERKDRILCGFYGGPSGAESGRSLSKGDLCLDKVPGRRAQERAALVFFCCHARRRRFLYAHKERKRAYACSAKHIYGKKKIREPP